MSDNPRVSVIVPMYNCEDFIAECLDSVLRQTLCDFELICVDDGSSDATRVIVEDRAKRDGRVQLLRQENAGPGVARNKALGIASGEYVYCLDADDFVEPGMLACCVSSLDDSGADIALVAFRTYNQQVQRAFPAEWGMRNEDVYPSYPGGMFSWKTNPDLFFETVQNVPWNKMVRRSLLKERGICFQELYLTEDLMYSLPVAISANRIIRLSQPLVNHREFAGTNIMANKDGHPLDFLAAFEALRVWLQGEDVYERLRLAYQTWLLDAIYYNLPTYRDYPAFSLAYDWLISDDLIAFDLADLRLEDVRDHRHRELLTALRIQSPEQFLLTCANVEAAEVQEQKCGFQERQTSAKWLWARMRDRVRA